MTTLSLPVSALPSILTATIDYAYIQEVEANIYQEVANACEDYNNIKIQTCDCDGSRLMFTLELDGDEPFLQYCFDREQYLVLIGTNKFWTASAKHALKALAITNRTKDLEYAA
jgi:hypothetical protein